MVNGGVGVGGQSPPQHCPIGAAPLQHPQSWGWGSHCFPPPPARPRSCVKTTAGLYSSPMYKREPRPKQSAKTGQSSGIHSVQRRGRCDGSELSARGEVQQQVPFVGLLTPQPDPRLPTGRETAAEGCSNAQGPFSSPFISCRYSDPEPPHSEAPIVSNAAAPPPAAEHHRMERPCWLPPRSTP